jgi:predicted transcriptional regulator
MTPRPQFDVEYIQSELTDVGTELQTEVTVYLIGGGAMAFRGLKDTTKDIDLVATSETAFNRLLAGLDDQGYEEVSDLDETYQQLGARLCVENPDGCRIDVFNRQVANKLIFSDAMRQRSEEHLTSNEFTVRLTALEDIFLFKTVAKRPDDIDDMNTLVQTSLDFNAIEEEIATQVELLGGKQFTTHVRESLDELYEQYEIQTPLEDVIDDYYAQYMNELEVRLVLSEDDPMSVEAIADKRDLDRDHVVEQLQQLEAFGYVEQTDAGFVDTGKRDAFNEEPDR